MRTRTSPRNQEILWKALGGEAKPKPPALDDEAQMAELVRQMNLPFMNKSSRAVYRRQIEKLRIKIALKVKSSPAST